MKVNLKPSRHIFESLFGKMGRAIFTASEAIIAAEGGSFYEREGGHGFKIAVRGASVTIADPARNGGGNTRLSVYLLRNQSENFPVTASILPELRIDVPTIFLRRKDEPRYWLYNIRFAISPDALPLDSDSAMPLRVGYYGITKRSVFKRFSEHQRAAASGKGHLLHKAWRGLNSMGGWFYPVIQISGFAKTLDEIYDMEEAAVAQMSLAPKGLNVIPGGKAGLAMLHELSLVSGRKIDPDARDRALSNLELREPGSKCSHYRSGHFRKLQNGKSAWVSPCWVNANREVE